MAAKNMDELERMLRDEIKKAMKIVAKKSEDDLYDATKWFYSAATKPTRYVRTGELGRTPRVTDVKTEYVDGGTVSFTAYLDSAHIYTTGVNPTMGQVLLLANDDIRFKIVNSNGDMYEAKPTVGNEHFWERALDDIEKDFDGAMGTFFTKS